MSLDPILRVERISKTYQAQNGEIEAIREISFTVEEGEYISIVGPSGSGKSTLLSMIAGLYAPSGGSVFINGEPVCGISQEIGYMLQNDNLLEWRSILKNVLLGLEIRKMATAENIAYTEVLLEKYGLMEFRDKFPSQLSGGMRQRVALIRTLAVRPKILLLDEAFSALDYQTRLALTDDVYRILKAENITTIMVTHDIPESISMSDRIIVLTKRPAGIKAIHRIEFRSEVSTPDAPPSPSDAGDEILFPLDRRNHPRFGRYFNEIWRELDVHV